MREQFKRSQPRQRLTLAEADYRYGTGPVTMLVDSIGAPIEVDGDTWIEINGDQLFTLDGREHRTPRTLQARLTAVRSLR